MKTYKEITIPQRISKVEDKRQCDLCGRLSDDVEWEGKSVYKKNDTEIFLKVWQKEGVYYPEGAWGTTIEIDLCPNCFKKKLVPWLRSQGAIIKEEEWEI